MIKILTKITIIVVKNRGPYYFIIIYKCKEVPLSLFSYQMLASIFDSDERSNYYKIYDFPTVFVILHFSVGASGQNRHYFLITTCICDL